MDIFSFINPLSNDILSNFNDEDINELLDRLKCYKIQYRDHLNIPKCVSFGTEFEVCALNRKHHNSIKNSLLELNNELLDSRWYFDYEPQVPYCIEFVSPILYDYKNTWDEVKAVCEVLKNNNAIVNDNTGGHIHFGLHILGNNKNSWINFIKLWAIYENIIYRFAYGEYEKERKYIDIYASTLSSKFLRFYSSLCNLDDISLKKLLSNLNLRYKSDSIGIYNYEDNITSTTRNCTIEIRCPNASDEEVIWQNNINFFYHLMSYCNSKAFNNEVIEKRIYDIAGIQDDLSLYREIFIEQAIELADLIFDNNLDKLNFLRQYLKDYSSSDCFVKCKKFIK